MDIDDLLGLGEYELPDVLTLADMAADLDLPLETVRTYLKRARRHRAHNCPRPGDLPEPDVRLGQAIGWTRATYEEWKSSRPGRGVGGGRGNRRYSRGYDGR